MSEQRRQPAAQVAMARKAAELKKKNQRKQQQYRPQRSRQSVRAQRRSGRLQDNSRTEASDGESADDSGEPDSLVPDVRVCRELGNISRMTLYRRTQEDPDFPPQVQVAGRNYRFRSALEAYKRRLLEQAVRGQRQRITLRTGEPADKVAP